jgi:hypothetical protein
MARSWQFDYQRRPVNGEYFVFSIEEISTIEFNDIVTVDDE